MFNVRYRSIDVLYITSRLSSQRRNDISPSNWPHLLTGHPVTSPLIKCVDAIEVERSTCSQIGNGLTLNSPCGRTPIHRRSFLGHATLHETMALNSKDFDVAMDLSQLYETHPGVLA
ncbi:hypothetical protein HZH68_015155 [Vespula germanica]|uniref:Uncharacterized protein n=2 Tax=Vespula TaxID=7451 RepID=A0A834J945_VESGE|nr:hypothetical protein HZH68_015155 [Vespula germanica]KAF7398156.1 hypothetical protein H0235_016164 [Vespula pensylvanica]